MSEKRVARRLLEQFFGVEGAELFILESIRNEVIEEALQESFTDIDWEKTTRLIRLRIKFYREERARHDNQKTPR